MGSSFWRKSAAALLAFLLSQPGMTLYAQDSPQEHRGDRDGHRERADLVRLLRQRVKYVFVFYQENRSFDSYFGTFPGADGLFTRDAGHTPGFNQPIINTDGTMGMIHPFRIGPKDMCPLATVNGVVTPTACYAADTDDIDHSHARTVAKMDVQGGTALMDNFAVTEERKFSPSGNPSKKAKQFGELAMAYEDCDTVPILWQYASKFVLFDHIFETVTGPSTPGNLSIIGAQSGETQWVRHPDQAFTDNGNSKPGVPVLNDLNPLWGSPNDPNMPPLVPGNPGDFPGVKPGTANTQINLTFATLPLTLPGGSLPSLTATDNDPDGDLGDVKEDVEFIAGLNKKAVPFGWYEEGYDKEVTDTGAVDANGTHASYITHHNGPQYFGYVSNNPQMVKQLHGLGDFFDDVEHEKLPHEGGVFYVKGGFKNLFGLLPTDPDMTVRAKMLGDDDHPQYSDAQISEAMVAEAINKIASSKYWKESAIIITWDDSEGDYDHVPPPIRADGPATSMTITNGPRVPLLLISPYARTGYVAHDQGSHSSVVKFIDTVFGLPSLALLPDEFFYRFVGEEMLGQANLGPEDAITPGISDLLSAFDRDRLEDDNPLPPSYVKIPEKLIMNLPDATGFGCKDLGIVTTDRALGIKNEVPTDFNPRPTTNPTP